MNRIAILIFLLPLICQGQVPTRTLDFNNISANVSSCGLLFNDPNAGVAGFNFPSGSNKAMLNQLTDWYGAIDSNGQL